MRFFSEEQVHQLHAEAEDISERALTLQTAFLRLQYRTDFGREYGHHGVSRRISTLAHCIVRVFELLPPEAQGIPEKAATSDATVFIQGAVFNTYGTLDNLAFIWVHERHLTGPNGRLLQNNRIGLSPDRLEVMQSLPKELRDHLETFRPWFANLKGFRHALGHRIPLYIPPFSIRYSDKDEYEKLETEKHSALLRFDVDTHQELERQQSALAIFQPYMKHSFNDPHPPVVFHAQLLADFATLEDICRRMLAALHRPSSPECN
jgi:hypothetical protein